jgi:hypothetical protein
MTRAWGLGRVAAVLVLGAVSCGGRSSAIPVGSFCGSLVDTACDRAIRCGTVADDRDACRAQAAAAMDECPLIVDAVGMGEVDYDANGAGAYLDAYRAVPCNDPASDPTASGLLTPKRGSGDACHSKVSCQSPLVCEGHSTATPAGICSAPAT